MSLPQAPLDLRTELQLTAGTWTAISTDVYQRDGVQPPVVLQRGRADESGKVNPSSAVFQLNNRLGKYSPRNAASPYYGQLGRNTPVRFSVPAQAAYLRFEADSTSTVSTPSSSALNVAGDLEVQIDCRVAFSAAGWSVPLVNKWGSSGQFSWWAEVHTDGRLRFFRSTDGTSSPFVASANALPPGRAALKITYAPATGTVTFYTAPAIAGPWTQFGAAQQFAGGGAIFASTAPVTIGSTTQAAGITGSVYALKMLSGIGGAPVASPDFTAAAPGVPSVTDAQGNVWTLGGTAEISSRSYRYHGEMSSLPPRWDVSGNDIYVPAAAGGLLRRIGQGSAPLMSPMKRAVLLQSGNFAPHAYWTMEDSAGATSFGSATGGPPLTFDASPAPALASDSSFLASAPLPALNGSRIRGNVAAYSSHGAIVVRFLARLGAVPSGAAGATLVRILTTGTCANVVLTVYSGGNLGISGWDAGNSNVFQTGAAPFAAAGENLWYSLELTASGGTVTAQLAILGPGGALASDLGAPPSYAGTIGNVTQVQVDPGGFFTDTIAGHVSVQSAWSSLFNLGQPLNAWQGETAGNRFARIAGENGYAARIIGAPDTTAPMGAQPVDTLGNILQQCEDADHGQIFEPRQVLGLGYRTLASLLNQAPAVTLDYSQAQPGGVSGDGSSELEPAYDDLLTRNDQTVTRGSGSISGATYQYQLADGSAMSIASPPQGAGDYADSRTVNVQSDSQLPDQAGWLVHTGTVDEARWPALPLNLARSELASLYYTLLELDIGDYAQMQHMLSQVTADPVRQLIWQLKESLGGFHHAIEPNCVPESPYEVAVFDDPVYGQADTDGSALALPAGSADTTLTVASTAGPAWTQAAADFPFDIQCAGERITVSSIAQAAHPLCRVGAYLNDSAYGADFTGAYTAWQSLGGPAIGVSRAYYGPSSFGVPLRTDVQEMITAGIKICIDLQPGFSPLSSTDLANMTTFLQALKTAGAECDISLWHEPFFSGLTAAQYIAMIGYYGPAVRQYYPLALCLSGADTDPANGYYPPDSWYDKIAVDAYAFSSTAQITNAAAKADSTIPPKPFGVWEFNGATDAVNGQSQSAVTTFFSFIQNLMTARQAQGKANADLILFSSGNPDFLGTGLSQAAGFEGGIGNWQNSSNCTVAAGTIAHSGTGSLKMTAAAAGNMLARHCNSTLTALQAHAMPVTAGQIAAVSAWFQAAATPRSCQVPIIITDSAGTVLSTTFGAAVADTAGGWTQVTNNVTAPANAAWAVVETEVVSAALGEVHYVDDVYLGIIPASPDLTQAIQFSWDYRLGLLSSMQSALNNTSYPQAFTVTRSVNGVVKSQSAGADVRLWFPPVLSMV